MNVEPTQQPTTDDPELAKVLAGNDGQDQSSNDSSTQSGLQFEETPLNGDQHVSTDGLAADVNGHQAAETADEATYQPEIPTEPSLPTPADLPATAQLPDQDESIQVSNTEPSSDLESIKKDALGELRPLIDKLALPADEKFDIMLLIIRSNDDQSLVAAAHTAAKQIEDETKRAQALLDIVKEIDYFASQSH